MLRGLARFAGDGGGVDFKRIISEAAAALKSKADGGDAQAQVTYGEFLYNSDRAGAKKYFEKSASAGSPLGRLRLGQALNREGNTIGALKEVGAAADSGLADASYELGMMLFDTDKRAAAEHLKKAADGGNVKAMRSYAFMLLDGEDVARDEEAATELFRKADEAGAGAERPNLARGLESEARDLQQAVAYFEREAQRGSAPAKVSLAIMVREGRGCAKDEERALKLIDEAARGGDVNAIFVRGAFLEQGVNGKVDAAGALAAYEDAAARGSVAAMAAAARMLQEGVGCAVDVKKATQYLRMGADEGDTLCQNAFAFNAAGGVGMDRDVGLATRYLERAVAAGSSMAMNNLGILLLREEPRNEARALDLFRQAAALGDPMGAMNAGAVYHWGLGVPADLAAAREWYGKAARVGFPLAHQALAELDAHSSQGAAAQPPPPAAPDAAPSSAPPAPGSRVIRPW